MALAVWQSTITDESGNVVPYAKVRIRREDTQALALLKTDRAGAASDSNPASADENGFIRVFMLGGAHHIQPMDATEANLGEALRYVAIGLAGETDFDVGISGGLNMAFDDGTTDADPGAGLLRFNHATPASVTFIYADLADSFGSDITAWLESLDDTGGSTNKGRLHIQVDGNAAVWADFRVSGAVVTASGYRKIPVVHIASAGTISDADPLALIFTATSSPAPIQSFAFTGAGAAGPFTLPAVPSGIERLIVFIDGVAQRPTTDYTVSTDQLTFDAVIPSGLPITGFLFE